jgi:bacteriocin-like protein
MSIENQNPAPPATGMTGELTDAELNSVTGGDKATTTTKPPTKPTDKKTDYLTITMDQTLISG